MLSQYLEAGRVVGTHGVRGELRVEPWCDSAEFLAGFSTLYWDGGAQSVQAVSKRVHKNMLLLKLQGVDTIEQGDLLRGRVLYISRDDVKLPQGRHFIQDLVGSSVVDVDTGICYGKLTQVLKTGANDVYEVTDESSREFLLPVIQEVVKDIDIENGVIKIRPMKGIFDDED